MILSYSPLIPHIERFNPEIEAWLMSLSVWPGGVVSFEQGVLQWFAARAPGMARFYRRYVADQGPYLSVEGGERWVAEIGNLSGMTHIIGANEATGGDAASVEAVNAHYVGLARACAARGVKPAGPNIAVGNPDEAFVHLLIPCINEILAAGGLVTYHGYGPRHLHTAQEWLLHRAAIRWPLFGINVPHNRWAYTEAGWDNVGIVQGEPSGPWRELIRRGLLDIPTVCAELDAFALSSMSLGVRYTALWTFGGLPGWEDYEFMREPQVLNWLAGHWALTVTPPPPPPPPPPPLPKRIMVWPGGTYQSAYLRKHPDERQKMGTIYRSETAVVHEEINGYYRITPDSEMWIPVVLTRPVNDLDTESDEAA